MAPVGSEPTISAGERPQIYSIERAAAGIDRVYNLLTFNEPQPASYTLIDKSICPTVKYFFRVMNNAVMTEGLGRILEELIIEYKYNLWNKVLDQKILSFYFIS